MKTISDFKKRIALGVKIHTIYHQAFAGRDENGKLIFKDEDKGTREVSIVQASQFALKTPKDGKFVDSWMKYPKASEVIILDQNSIQILGEDFRLPKQHDQKSALTPILTYKFVQ